MRSFPITRRHLLLTSAGAAVMAAAPRLGWAQEPQRGGRLIVAADSEPTSLNPAIVASNAVFFVASKVIEPLAEASYEGQDGLAPKLATAWEGSEDGRTVTFTLREGVTWHDGKPFSSADVAFSAMQVWKPLQNLGRVVFRNLEAVDTPDARTAIFRFSSPTPFQLIRNALPALTSVLPKHAFEGTDIAANTAMIGTGPFRFVEHRPGEYYLVERNENYWDEGLPYLDEIVFQVLPDRAAAASALESGEIHLAAFSMVPLADLQRISQVPGIKIYTAGYEALTYQLIVEINHRREELSNPLVRRAIGHAIDRNFVVDTIFLGYAKPSTGPVPAYDQVFYEPNTPSFAFDVEEANRLLDEAGYPRGPDGTRFSLRLLPAPFFNETRQFGDYLRQALAEIGIDAEIVSNDAPAHLAAVYTNHDFDLAVGSPVYRGDPAISTTVLFQSGLPAGVPFSNQYGYANPAVDDLIARAAAEPNDQARAALYKEFQRAVVEDVALINVVEFTFITVARDNVMNVSNNPRWAVSSWADTWLQQ